MAQGSGAPRDLPDQFLGRQQGVAGIVSELLALTKVRKWRWQRPIVVVMSFALLPPGLGPKMGSILVTGSAGFIGYHVCQRLIDRGKSVTGVDNISPNYDPSLKRARIANLLRSNRFRFFPADLEDSGPMGDLFDNEEPTIVIHLAARTGVRSSLVDPRTYAGSNVIGFLTVLEACRHHPVQHLVYASSSSVYGFNAKLPFATTDRTDQPVSFYGATKKANEVMAYSYSHLFGFPATGLRFFTVYGPWGRPDMSYFLFTKAILEGKPIDVYNHGRMVRDFTYVDDVVEGIVRIAESRPIPRASPGGAASAQGTSHRIYNIGNSRPVPLAELIATIEGETGRKAKQHMLPMQPGDVPATFADIEDLKRDFEYCPSTPLNVGIRKFVAWYREYYQL